MSKSEIQSASSLKLLAYVFGKKEGQDLKAFAEECRSVKDDAAFIEEVRAHALAEAVE